MATPTYVRIRDYLERAIQRANGESVKLLTEVELCERFGVTRPTVRKALGEFTKRGALISKKGLGTFVNADRASANEETRTPVIDVIIQSGHNIYVSGYAARFFAGAASALADAPVKYRLVSLAGRGEKAAGEILTNRPDGVLWIFPAPTKECFKTLETVHRSGTPLMAITVSPSLYFDGLNYVELDFEEGGYLAAKHLLETGHENIVFAALEKDYDPNRNAYRGFVRAHAERGATHDERLCLRAKNGIEMEIDNLLRRGARFSGIFTLLAFFGDIAAALRHHRLTVPGDIAIVTQYGPELSRFPDINPITLREPLEEMGRVAAEQLLDIFRGAAKSPSRTTLKPVLST